MLAALGVILSAILFPITLLMTISSGWSALTEEDRGSGGIVAITAGIFTAAMAVPALGAYGVLFGLN